MGGSALLEVAPLFGGFKGQTQGKPPYLGKYPYTFLTEDVHMAIMIQGATP